MSRVSSHTKDPVKEALQNHLKREYDADAASMGFTES